MQFNIATLALRLSFGLSMALAHGLPKLMNFAEMSPGFADPLGIGPVPSMAFVVFAEFFCALLVAFGVLTRYSAIPVIIVMAVACFHIHGGADWGTREASFLFGIAFLAMSLLGSGRFSLDYLVFKKR
ncbi:MAG: DoxX family protein [Myxococcota bacterium]